MRHRTLAASAALVVVVGLAATVASLAVVTEIHPAVDSYAGEARLFGLPMPYTYEVLYDGGEMEAQVSCTVAGGAWACDYPHASGRFGIFPFAVDWLLWCIVALPIVTGGVALVRWRGARPSTTPGTEHVVRPAPTTDRTDSLPVQPPHS